MPLASLKDHVYHVLEHPAIFKKLRHIQNCPYNLAEPFLKLMTPHQLLLIEDNTPRLGLYTQPLWRAHTLKLFPTIGETHEIDGDAAADADWRATYEDMQQDRLDREQSARERLKARYNKIADGKSEKAIQVIKAQPLKTGRSRGSLTSRSISARAPVKPGLAIMNKALKSAMHSTTRTPGNSSISTTNTPIRPNPNQARTMKPTSIRCEPVSRPSKFLLPTIKK